AALQARAVVAKTAPPPPPPSFAKQQEAIQANGGRPLAISQMHQIQLPAVQARANIKVAPAATPRTIPSRGGVQADPSRPVGANTAVHPAGNPPASNNSPRNFADRPAMSQPKVAVNPNNAPNRPYVNPELEQQHQKQLQNLRAQQDQERQRIEQQQQKDRVALAQKAADEKAQQRLNQQHQQQLEQLEKKHDAEQQQLKQQQQAEKKKDQKPPNPPKEGKPQKNNK
ncbi:MAG: hypothetical protein WA639_23890, partial [Candidatus Acidiferrum sp.]